MLKDARVAAFNAGREASGRSFFDSLHSDFSAVSPEPLHGYSKLWAIRLESVQQNCLRFEDQRWKEQAAYFPAHTCLPINAEA